ncbi:hypothetical protein KFK09_008709 [Dendrobium nobile]|uniref:Uncharacterized protein n=1 Tax=Dendrobium nobile TaxID=94219 RepID=A0A8T3BLW5_DENNO|nr:hypothetical protein KFK09_008709 [Dendrobium nobile]
MSVLVADEPPNSTQVCTKNHAISCGDGSSSGNAHVGLYCDESRKIELSNYRCGHPYVPITLKQESISCCPQGVCVFTPMATATPTEQKPSSPPLSQLGGSVFSGKFSWIKLQHVPIDRLIKEIFFVKDGLTMELEINAVNKNISRLEKTLIAKHIGRHIPFPYIISELKRRWY